MTIEEKMQEIERLSAECEYKCQLIREEYNAKIKNVGRDE